MLSNGNQENTLKKVYFAIDITLFLGYTVIKLRDTEHHTGGKNNVKRKILKKLKKGIDILVPV